MFENYIKLDEIAAAFCIEFRVCLEFADFGLFTVTLINKEHYIAAAQLKRIKAIINLYKNLGVNKEGIEVILALRKQIESLKQEQERLTYIIQHMEQEELLRNIQLPREQGLIIEIEQEV